MDLFAFEVGSGLVGFLIVEEAVVLIIVGEVDMIGSTVGIFTVEEAVDGVVTVAVNRIGADLANISVIGARIVFGNGNIELISTVDGLGRLRIAFVYIDCDIAFLAFDPNLEVLDGLVRFVVIALFGFNLKRNQEVFAGVRAGAAAYNFIIEYVVVVLIVGVKNNFVV